MRPLDGVVVVACEQAVAAPLATRHLADLGARVIKVERPEVGDFARDYDETVLGMSSHFVWLNRSKESIALDLKELGSLEVMKRLLARADVFVQNFAPGAIDRLGLGIATLRANYPSLITCSISGYGSEGPYRDFKAYDLLIQSEAGVVAVTGTEDSPAKVGIPVADIGAGMYAFSGIMAALLQRQATGLGSDVEISLFDSLIEWMGYPLYYTRYGGTPPPRAGTSHAAIAPYGSIRLADGTEVVLAIQNEREWISFCTNVLQKPELAADPRFNSAVRRVSNRHDLYLEIDAALQGLGSEMLIRRLEGARIAYSRQRDVGSVLAHPQLVGRKRWTHVMTPVGEIDAVLPPINIDGVVPRMEPVPAIGEHTQAILSWLDINDVGEFEPDGELPAR